MDLHLENGRLTPQLRTERLTLRPLTAADASAVLAALNEWEVTQWLTMVPYPYAQKDFDWFLTMVVPEADHLVWAIDAGAGLIGLISAGDTLGYWLDRHHHGRGIMTEAAMAVTDWFFRNREGDLVSGHHLGNVASRTVLLRQGFRDTHCETITRKADGATVTLQRMVLTLEDWQQRHG